MLKYERIAKDNKIAVTYKDRTSLFTTDFILALATAIGLHLSFLLLFSIKDIGLLFHMKPSKLIFNVESDPILNQITLDAEAEQGEAFLSEPPYDGRMTLTMPIFNVEKHFDESLMHSDTVSLGLPWEERFPKTQSLLKGVEVQLYHAMANRTILNKEAIVEFEKIHGKGYSQFQVQVDDQLGQVIWSELKSSSGNRLLDQKAKQLLHALTFDRIANSFVTLGEVEIIFHD